MTKPFKVKVYPFNIIKGLTDYMKIKEFDSLSDAQIYAYTLGDTKYNIDYWDFTDPDLPRVMNMYEQLIQMIREYESDTFFAKGRGLTDQESIKLADRCIQNFIDNRLDGVILECGLDEIRGEY